MSLSEERTQIVTLSSVDDLCRQATEHPPARADGYRPTTPQVYFFTHLWLRKGKTRATSNDDPLVKQDGELLTLSAASSRVRHIAENLEEWGAAVSGLKNRDEKEWELLRQQTERTVRRYHCPQEIKDDALQTALIKVWTMLDEMMDAVALDAAEDAPSLLNETRQTGLYDFGSPFYAYAKRIASNELISILRRIGREPILWTPLEALADALLDPSQLPEDQLLEDEDTQTDYATVRLQRQIDLQRLLDLIESLVTTRQRQVVRLTLAARPQFWRTLAAVQLQPPDDVTRLPDSTTDTELARMLSTTENNIRSLRSQAKKRIDETDQMLGSLLERLLAAR